MKKLICSILIGGFISSSTFAESHYIISENPDFQDHAIKVTKVVNQEGVTKTKFQFCESRESEKDFREQGYYEIKVEEELERAFRCEGQPLGSKTGFSPQEFMKLVEKTKSDVEFESYMDWALAGGTLATLFVLKRLNMKHFKARNSNSSGDYPGNAIGDAVTLSASLFTVRTVKNQFDDAEENQDVVEQVSSTLKKHSTIVYVEEFNAELFKSFLNNANVIR